MRKLKSSTLSRIGKGIKGVGKGIKGVGNNTGVGIIVAAGGSVVGFYSENVLMIVEPTWYYVVGMLVGMVVGVCIGKLCE